MALRISLAGLLLMNSALGCDGAEPDVADTVRSAVPERRAEVEGRIGSLDDPDQSLTRVGQVVIGPEDQLFVSQPADGNVRLYGSDGTLITTIGRKGEGAGEFVGIEHIGLKGDTLYVSDANLGRVSFFSLEGRFWGSTRWITRLEGSDVWFRPGVPQVFLPDGTALTRFRTMLAMRRLGETGVIPLPPSITAILRVDAQSHVLDTVAWNEATNMWIGLAVEGAVSYFAPPFRDYPLMQLAPDGSGVVIVDRRAAPDTRESLFRVVKVGPVRDTAVTRSFPYRPVPITEEWVRHVLEEAVTFPPGLRPQVSDMERALRGAGLIPKVLVPVTDLVLGQDGSIWLRREDVLGDSVVWNVLNDSAQLEGELRLPTDDAVVAVNGDLVVAIERDEFDVPYLVRYRVHR